MGSKFFSVWYHSRASMTTLFVLRYNWRFKLRRIIPTSRPRPCLLHWVACLNSCRLDDIPYMCSCRKNFSVCWFVNKYGLPDYYQSCILTFITTLAKFTSCLMYVYHIYMVSAMSCSYSNNVSQTSSYNIEYKCSYWTFLCWLKIGMALLQQLFW